MEILINEAQPTLANTASKMLKIFLSRELALQYSYTGFGAHRKRTKLEFQKTKSCMLIHGKFNIIL